MEESRESAPPPTRSGKYYMGEGDVIVKVENTLFRFHAYHLQRSTTYFDDLLATTPPPPLEDDGAGDYSINLDDVKASDFQALLWFYYESGCSWVGTDTSSPNESWKSVLELAEKFAMEEVAKVACYALHRGEARLGDSRKISLCVRYDLPRDWMKDQINRVLSRKRPLSTEECSQLGPYLTALLIFHREEASRTKRITPCKSPRSCPKCAQKTAALSAESQVATAVPSTVTCFQGVHICGADASHYWECATPVRLSPFVEAICNLTKKSDIHPVMEEPRHNAWGSVQGDTYCRVEDITFSIHSFYLVSSSPVFADMFALPSPSHLSPHSQEGRSPGYPIVLEGESAATFRNILWFFYDAPYEWSERVDSDLIPKWESILQFATKYAMGDVCKVAACALDHHGALSDARKISLGAVHGMDPKWAQAAYTSICARPDTLTVKEADELGTVLTIKIVEAREERLQSQIDGKRRSLFDFFGASYKGSSSSAKKESQ